MARNFDTLPEKTDVLVVGGGIAGFCAALAARERGAKVLVLDRAGVLDGGGNSRFALGAFRAPYEDVDDLKRLMPDLSLKEIASADFGSYSENQYYEDLENASSNRCDRRLADLLVHDSRRVLQWMKGKGVQFNPSWARPGFNLQGKYRFWGGLTIEATGQGQGLANSLLRGLDESGVELHSECRAQELLTNDSGICGVRVMHGQRSKAVYAKQVVLAAGGFQANPAMRAQYLGRNWDLAKVTGSHYNTGDGLRMAQAVGAACYGHWSGCHSLPWDAHAPEFGDVSMGDGFQRNSFNYGLMLNVEGKRFCDEGEDFSRNIFDKISAKIIDQPQQLAWQIFDQKTACLQRDEYREQRVTRYQADNLVELLAQLENIDLRQALDTLNAYNYAVGEDAEFSPGIKDGRCTHGLAINKSNWATRIDAAPFEAFEVTCGVTMTFGGLRVNAKAEVLDDGLEPIRGLYAAGDVVGGLYYDEYLPGSGLMAAAVLGYQAGHESARACANLRRVGTVDHAVLRVG